MEFDEIRTEIEIIITEETDCFVAVEFDEIILGAFPEFVAYGLHENTVQGLSEYVGTESTNPDFKQCLPLIQQYLKTIPQQHLQL